MKMVNRQCPVRNRMLAEEDTKPNRFKKPVRFTMTKMVNIQCPVRDRMLVERGTACMSRGLPAVFQVTGSVLRETSRKVFLQTFRLYEIINLAKPNRFFKPVRFTMTASLSEAGVRHGVSLRRKQQQGRSFAFNTTPS
jgi:hypothetical protein